MQLPDLRVLVFVAPIQAPHVNDGERMAARYGFSGEGELRWLTGLLGIELREITPEERSARTYRVGDPSPIAGYEHLANPGHVSVGGVDVFVWFGRGYFDVEMLGAANPYVLDEADSERARRLDEFLLTSGMEPDRIPYPIP